MEIDADLLEILRSPPAEADLLRGATLFAAQADPTLDTSAIPDALDRLAEGCPEATMRSLGEHLFGEAGFRGDTDDYYAPENSLLDRVIQRRRGLPISLAVVTIEVGRRLDVPLHGVAMPGHFLVQHRDQPGRFLDPFSGGAELGAAECQDYFKKVAGETASWHPSYLTKAEPGDILVRIAANLVNAYRRRDDRRGLGWAATARAACPGLSPVELEQLAKSLTHCGVFDRSAEIYTDLATLDPENQARWSKLAIRQLARLN